MILDMASYAEVTTSHNIELLKRSFSIEGINNPSYMPITRDLSHAKRVMILSWLDNPLYDSMGREPPVNTSRVCKNLPDMDSGVDIEPP